MPLQPKTGHTFQDGLAAEHAELFVGGPDGRWLLGEYGSKEESVPLESAGCVLPLSEVYDKVVFSDSR